MLKNEPEQLTLLDIAAWQVPEVTIHTPTILATLPSLQRGAVWKPKQIENLWDSLMRGFPVGCFLVAPYNDKSLGQRKMPYAHDDQARTYTHYLLDGQQRATAIALGFIDQIRRTESATLWLDLSPTADKNDDRQYAFRTINRFHPWGFSPKPSQNRLEAGEMREAFDEFVSAARDSGLRMDLNQISPSKIPLKYAWPWGADAPIPVAFLWSVTERYQLLEKLAELPYWHSHSPPNWKSRTEAAISGKDENLSKRLEYIMKRFDELKKYYMVPVLKVQMETNEAVQRGAATEQPDHVETLFIRVNAGGTPLEGEELIYSILKSEWNDAPELIDNLTHHITSPARTVVLAARLVLARAQEVKQDKPTKQPPAPDVAMFRRLLRGIAKEHSGFKDELKQLVKEDGAAVFKSVHDFLSIGKQEKSTSKRDFRLHPYLVADLASGPGGREVYLLLLRWIDRLLQAGIALVSIPEDARRRTLGFITTLAWFHTDATECVSRLWSELQICDVGSLPSFFNAERFRSLIIRKDDQNAILIPPVPAHVFRDSLLNLYQAIEEGGFDDKSSLYWNSGEFYRNHKREVLTGWMESAIYPLWQEKPHEDVEAWWVDRVWADRRFVIYAQREWLLGWFPDYDPTVPGAADTNRPWDYDHIHPNNYVYHRKGVPNFLRNLHWSNGNYRAWPMEANRALQDAAPYLKLKKVSDYEVRYGMNDDDLCPASFIGESKELEMWLRSIPSKVISNNKNYLASQEYKGNHLALVYAILMRLERTYAEWYENLRMDDLLPK